MDNKNIALIFAGGTGSRMNTASRPKQFLTLHGKEIIIHTIEQFENACEIDGIVVVCINSWIDYLNTAIEKNMLKKVHAVVPGGNNGQESIYLGLKKIHEDFSDDSIVLIHDGVRPLIDSDLINRNIDSVRTNGSCITVAPAIETIISVKDSFVDTITDRKSSYYAKAPQSFFLRDIYHAHTMAISEGRSDFIDSASIMKHYGYKLSVVECSYDNIKITTPSDYYIFKAILESKENSQIFGI